MTLILTALKEELGLESIPDPLVIIRALADGKVANGGRIDFRLESLYSGERYHISNAFVEPEFFDEKGAIPHAVDITTLEHFHGVEIPAAPNREYIDILIGQSAKLYLMCLKSLKVKTHTCQTFRSFVLGLLRAGEESHMVQIIIFLLGKFLLSVLMLNVKLAK